MAKTKTKTIPIMTRAIGNHGNCIFGHCSTIAWLRTLAMYPVLIWMYTRLAKSEEKDTRAAFGGKFDVYAKRVPAFLPYLKTITRQLQ
jgi:hypothetical protein